MSEPKRFRAIVLSVVKHDYIARAVAAHPRFDLVAVADDPAVPDWIHHRNQRFADEFGIDYVADLDRVCREHRPAVAIISSEAERHCELAVRAVKAGLHVIVDKPLSTRLSECDRLVQAVDAAGVRCLIWNRCALPAIRQTVEEVRRGAIGSLRAMHCDFYFSKDAGPPTGTRRPDDPPINWLERQIEAHADGSDGGVGVDAVGELENEGIYPLAYMRMLTDQKVRRVFARTTAHFHQAHVDNDVDDLSTVTLEMDGGLVGSLCIGRIGAASHPELGEIKLHLLGTEGALVISEARPEIAVYYRGQDPHEFRHLRVADENNYQLVEDFAVAIDTAGPTILDARAGRDICAIVQACLRSGRSQRVEDV